MCIVKVYFHKIKRAYFAQFAFAYVSLQLHTVRERDTV